MAALTKANFEAISDSLGIQDTKRLALAATTEATDLLAAAALNLDRIDDLADIPAQIQLLEAFNTLHTNLATPYVPATVFSTAIQRLAANVGGAFGPYLLAQGAYVSKAFADLAAAVGAAIIPAYVMPPAVVSLATFTITGSGTGTFGASSLIDRLVYAATPCEIEITTDIGAATATVNCTMVKQDGTTEIKAVVLASTLVVGNKVAVGSGTDKYVDCTAITVNSGSDSGAFKVQNILIRTPAA